MSDLCPCGCEQPCPPGRKYASGRVCRGRWEKAHGVARARFEAARALNNARKQQLAREAAAREHGAPLAPAEADLWRIAKATGYTNGQKVGDNRAGNAHRRTSNLARWGSRGGRRAGQRKHAAAFRRALARVGLEATDRTRGLWRGGYVLGYRRGLACAAARNAARRRLTAVRTEAA